MGKASVWRGILLVLAVALLLRLWHLDAPFSGHHAEREIMHAGEAEFLLRDGDFLHLKNYFGAITSTYYGELPTYVTYVSFRIFGAHEWPARLPVFFMSVLAVYFFYLLLRELYPEKQSLLGALMFAVAPFNVYFSRMLFSDAYLVFLSVMSALFFIRWHKNTSARDLLLFGAFFALSVHVKFTAVYLLAVFSAFLFLEKKASRSAGFFAVSLTAIALPFAWRYLVTGELIPQSASDIDFSVFRSAYYYVHWALVFAGGFSPVVSIAFAAGTVLALKKHAQNRFFLVWLLFGVATLVFSGQRAFLHDYYFLVLVPPVCALASLTARYKRVMHPLFLLFLVLSTLPFTFVFFSVERPYKEVADYFSRVTLPGEVIIQESPSAYYDKRYAVGYFSSVGELEGLEKKYDIRYIAMPSYLESSYYSGGPLGDYLEKNYRVEAVIEGKPVLFQYNLNVRTFSYDVRTNARQYVKILRRT